MITRSRAGKTLKKPSTFGLVETPRTRRQSRKSALPDRETSTVSTEDDIEEEDDREENNNSVSTLTSAKVRKRNGELVGGKTHDRYIESTIADNSGAGEDVDDEARSTTRARRANGNATRGGGSKSEALAKAPLKTRMLTGNAVTRDPKVEENAEFEFGGSVGVSIMMVTFPLLMYYMWIGQTYYNGHLPVPQPGEDIREFLKHLGNLAYEGAFPKAQAWAIYWTFLIFEALCYLYMPGIYVKGKPLPHEGGKKLDYYCSGQWSWYVTITLAIALHWSGVFKLYTLIDQFGPLMSVAIISGFAVSIIAYISALMRGAQHRMTGYPIYDFFMGAELNPRLLGWLDFKMFFEVRLPWFMFFLITLGTAARQYEQLGYVSAEVAFLLGAHFLYANACCKAEELIVITWDMYYEKWGFMLIFWNMAGVPLTYCHCTIYLANRHPDVYRWNRIALAALAITYLFVYWVWDTANSQKNMFRAQERGTVTHRKAFPQLPWKYVKNPRSIPTKTGDSLLCDGWYGKARKLHYTCDVFFAVTWALICGFESPFPWFYPAFFVPMIIHRASRDIQRCKERYGDAWEEYTRRVPWLFLPYVY